MPCLSLYSETSVDSWLVCCVASVSDNNRSESSIDFSVNPAVQFCLVFASDNRKSLVSTTPTRSVLMEIGRSGFNKPELCSCPSSTCRTSWQGGVCHGTGVLLCCWLQLKVTLRRESPPPLLPEDDVKGLHGCNSVIQTCPLVRTELERVLFIARVDVCVFCLQVSCDHQYPGWQDLRFGSSQPGQEAVGPRCWLRVPGVLQPHQTWGRPTPVLPFVFFSELILNRHTEQSGVRESNHTMITWQYKHQ